MHMCMYINTSLKRRASLGCSFSESCHWTTRMQVGCWCRAAHEPHWWHQRCCAFPTSLSPLPCFTWACSSLLGSRLEPVIYSYGKFAYAKNYAKSQFGTWFYGPSSKPHKNQGLKWKMLFRLIMSRAIGHCCSKLYFNILPNETIGRTRVLQTQARVLVTK